jgi:hypothetical protein
MLTCGKEHTNTCILQEHAPSLNLDDVKLEVGYQLGHSHIYADIFGDTVTEEVDSDEGR